MKIKKVKVRDLKAVKEQDIDFNGSSIIVTGGNNKGKSSVLNGLIERLRGEKPEMIVREGEKNGSYTMELTDGSIIEWKFTEKSEKFSFTTKDGLVIKSGIISAIGERYFGTKFDVDKFLIASDKQKYKMLSRTIGIDLDEIDERYSTAYADRTEKNRALKTLRENSVKKPELIERPDFDGGEIKYDFL